MEKLDELVANVMNTNGVIGAMIIDSDGLCLTESGSTNSAFCGPISELTTLASKLCGNQNPAIFLESDSCNLLVKRDGIITAAIYKQVS